MRPDAPDDAWDTFAADEDRVGAGARRLQGRFDRARRPVMRVLSARLAATSDGSAVRLGVAALKALGRVVHVEVRRG
jgi:hypothetical protein